MHTLVIIVTDTHSRRHLFSHEFNVIWNPAALSVLLGSFVTIWDTDNRVYKPRSVRGVPCGKENDWGGFWREGNRLDKAGSEAWEKVLSFPEPLSWNSLSFSSKRNHGNKLAKCLLLKSGNLFNFKRWETRRALKYVLDVTRAQQQWAQAISQAWDREQCGFWRISRLIRAKDITGAPPWQLAY